ncbi:MAG: hypothetical protein A3J40_03145 [Erythrobacter sp. RIFCSPHIGHO2_12_FULL_63_10]|nr:MAG: hypothetical protein A3J40_03145 [Erythrobacter sp. RIFCSPHIGHO2_12_FULL_63_10]
MSKLVRSALAASAALGLIVAPAAFAEEENDPHTEAPAELTKGEQRLAKLLEGRVAGEPKSCISNYPTSRMEVIDKTAYVFGRGNTIYVQRTHHPDDIDDDDVLIMRLYGSQLCRLDIVTTVDRTSRFYNGNVFLTDFVPYTRVKG